MSSKPLFVSGWEVGGIRATLSFFAAVVEVLPLPVKPCFLGTNLSVDVRALLASEVIAETLQTPPGSVWPKSTAFELLAIEQFIDELAAAASGRAQPEVCDPFSCLQR
jgi:hypothetical protein